MKIGRPKGQRQTNVIERLMCELADDILLTRKGIYINSLPVKASLTLINSITKRLSPKKRLMLLEIILGNFSREMAEILKLLEPENEEIANHNFWWGTYTHLRNTLKRGGLNGNDNDRV